VIEHFLEPKKKLETKNETVKNCNDYLLIYPLNYFSRTKQLVNLFVMGRCLLLEIEIPLLMLKQNLLYELKKIET
jgi:hypothetical protein